MNGVNVVAEKEYYARRKAALKLFIKQEWGLLYGPPGIGHYTLGKPFSGPRILSIQMLVNPAYTRQFKSRLEDFSATVGLVEGQRVSIRRVAGGRLSFEMPKDEGLWYDTPAAALPFRKGLEVSVGLDTEGNPVFLDFGDPLTSQLLVAGFTGSGKTFFLRWLVSRLAAQNLPGRVGFVLTDTEKGGIQWRDFASLAHLLHPVITDEAEAGRLLAWALEEIPRRAASGKREPEDVFLVMDETQGLLLNKGVARMAARVSGLGREVGVHLVLAVRNPNKDELGDINTKRNMARVVFKLADGIMAAVATGRPKSGAEFLAGPGDALLLETEGGMVRLATAVASLEAIVSLPQAASLPRLPLDVPEGEGEGQGAEPEGQGRGGRKAEPMNAKALAYLLTHPGASQNQVQGFLREETGHGMNWKRLPEHQEIAAAVRAALEAQGGTLLVENADG